MKTRLSNKSKLFTMFVGLFLCTFIFSCNENKPNTETANLVSRPGEYSGYSDPIYDEEYDTSSEYVEMRDGIKLAVDIYRPKDKNTGAVIEEPLPVLWMHTPYNRRYNENTTERMTVEYYAGAASRLVKYGYVVATADFRGLYGSYGHNEGYNRGEWVGAARNDAYDITEWLAVQPWSNGNIGMWGCSATGGSQMQAATTAPPHLKAIFPMSFDYDTYAFRVPGGISGRRAGRPSQPGEPTAQERRDALAAPVDADTDSTMLKQAIEEHKETIESAGYVPYRDSYSKELTDEDYKQWWVVSSPSTYLDEINNSGVAMYMAVNWNESHTKNGPYFAFNNITTPRKVIMGPGGHCDWVFAEEMTGFDIVVEELRFFDYWLKGVRNGIMDEDPVYYFTYNASEGSEWRFAKAWPLPEEKRVKYYLGEGSISTGEPSETAAKDATRVSYDSRQGIEGVLIYETAPLEDNLQITGHPEINLWVSSTATDGDFVATIRDVSPDGEITSYHVEGQLRASTRKLTEPPYNNLGLPWPSSSESDVEPLVPGKPTELVFPLLPGSVVFKAGHKIQLAISFAGRGTPKLNPAPVVTIYRDASHKSYVTLPIIE